jgi:hypothetical protein
VSQASAASDFNDRLIRVRFGTPVPEDVILPMAEERRSVPRRRILKAGSISVGGDAIDCTVRNISDAGATLEVVTPLFIPDRFKLIIQSDGLNRPCHIVWRKERRIGIALD